MGMLPLKLSWDMAQTRWAQVLNPFITNPATDSIILPNISLSTGPNIINHRLGRKLQGWKSVRIRSSATFYDTQDANQTPELTLVLVSSANAVVDLEVF